ncbi:MAG: glycosyltransferase [Anaerolineales bacterium]|nr:MAG: glycosyltransferase [Anaerolineales bacterium]
MKILFLTYQIAGQGGSYVRSFSLARQLVRLGHKVTLIASRSTPGLGKRISSVDGVRQIEMPDLMPRRVRHGGLSPFDILFRCIWIFLSERFDVIHTFEHRPAVMLPALIGQRAKGAILVSDWADLWGHEGIAAERSSSLERILGQADDFFETRVRLWVDGVTAISSDLDRRLDQMGVPKSQHMVLPPGANLDLIQPVDKQEARTKFGLPMGAPIVGFSGYAPYDEAFLSQSILDILRKDPDVMVISSGTVVEHLAKTAEQEGLADRLVQYGPLPLIKNGLLLGAADVLLLPYLNKPINRGRFPNKFGDFLAAGRPIVSHPTGDLGELIARENLGILSSELPEQFAEDVLQLLHSPDEAQRMGENARRFAERHWSWALRAQQVSDFYACLRS